jgi:hypothetical protein
MVPQAHLSVKEAELSVPIERQSDHVKADPTTLKTIRPCQSNLRLTLELIARTIMAQE